MTSRTCYCANLDPGDHAACSWEPAERHWSLTESPRELLAGVPLFRSSSREWIDDLAKSCRFRDFASQELLAVEGEPAQDLMIVHRGRVRAMRSRGGLWLQQLAEIGPGHPVNLVPVIDQRRTPFSVEAVAPGRMLLVPAEGFRKRLGDVRGLAADLLACLSSQARSLFGLAGELSLLTLEERLVRYLLQNAPAEESAELRPWKLTHEELATRVGGSREEVTRLLGRLKRKGLVSIARRSIRILDRDGLARLSPRMQLRYEV